MTVVRLLLAVIGFGIIGVGLFDLAMSFPRGFINSIGGWQLTIDAILPMLLVAAGAVVLGVATLGRKQSAPLPTQTTQQQSGHRPNRAA